LSVEENISAHHTFEGNAYNVNTGSLTLTSANRSGMLYFKNLEDTPIVITAGIWLIGNSDQTGGDTLIEMIRNPTGGDLLTSTALVPINRDFSSNNTLNATCTLGAEAKTLTGGTTCIESIFSGPGRKVVSVGALILKKGNSVGVAVTPQTGNTSQAYQIALSMYLAKTITTD
jgi:hypothetical protein